tara:strand:- start:15551 stop:17266 length:1716 start_codon:yes stop_codon:yes gene_type:complete
MNFKIFFINLKDNPEPWIKAQNIFSLLPDTLKVERIDAVDTRKDLSALEKFNLKLDPVGLVNKLYFSESPGAAGYYLNHFSAWQQIIEQKLDFALILEDDVVLTDVVQFLLENPDLHDGIELMHLAKKSRDRLHAYILSYNGAAKLIELTLDHSPLSKIDPSRSLFFNEKLNLKNIISKNTEFDWSTKRAISSPVDKFVMYCCSELVDDWHRLNRIMMPIIDLCLSSANNYPDAPKKENEIIKLMDSWRFEHWKKNPSITVCICTYNNYELLEQAFLSCQNQLGDYEYKIIILDNSPHDLRDNSKIIKLVENYNKNFWQENISKNQLSLANFGAEYYHKITHGLSGARNECIKLCTTDLIYFIDDDATLKPNAVANMVSKFKSPQIGVVGGKVTPDWGELIRPSWLSDQELGNLSMCDFSEKDLFLEDSEFPIWLVGANICFRTEYVRDVGGFNTSLGRKGGGSNLLSGEEDDLVRKIRQNYYALYTPDCEILHRVDESRLNQSWFVKRNAWQAVSNMIGGVLWIDEKKGVSEIVKNNIHLIFEEPKSDTDFDLKCKIIAYLTHLLLDGDI